MKFLLHIIGIACFCSLFFACSQSKNGDSPESTSNEKTSETAASSAAALAYKSYCKVCHAQGINGAPILGNKKMWSKRVSQGKQVLLKHAVEGYGLMPAKGGQAQLSEQDIAPIIDYMLSSIE